MATYIDPIEIYPQPDPGCSCDWADPETKPNYAEEARQSAIDAANASVLAMQYAEEAKEASEHPGNVYTIPETDALLALKADKATTYTKTQTDSLLNAKANASNVYTKSQTDNLLDTKADTTNVYTKLQTDALVANKANAADVYTKSQTDNLLDTKADMSVIYTRTETDSLLDTKANASNVYTKSQTNSLLADKVDTSDIGSIAGYDATELSNNMIQLVKNAVNKYPQNKYYGSGANIDINTVLYPCVLWVGNSAINRPDNTTGYLICDSMVSDSVNNKIQLLLAATNNVNAGKIYYRTYRESAWSEWHRLAEPKPLSIITGSSAGTPLTNNDANYIIINKDNNSNSVRISFYLRRLNSEWGTTNNIFTLASAYRPATNLNFPMMIRTSSNEIYPCTGIVRTDGGIRQSFSQACVAAYGTVEYNL